MVLLVLMNVVSLLHLIVEPEVNVLCVNGSILMTESDKLVYQSEDSEQKVPIEFDLDSSEPK